MLDNVKRYLLEQEHTCAWKWSYGHNTKAECSCGLTAALLEVGLTIEEINEYGKRHHSGGYIPVKPPEKW